MKTLSALTVPASAFLVLVLLPLSAQAGDRGTDAALGAVSGAVVFGPVGAVAGALVGFTAGPAIGHSWTFGGSSSRRAGYRQRASHPRDARESRATYYGPVPNEAAMKAEPNQAPAAGALPLAAPAQGAKNKAPPVQGLE
jgi:hypothetical protein